MSETVIAQRGPLRSTRVPPNAAESPSITMPSWKGSALAVPERWRADSRAGLKTLHAYACPMERCTESAAGGTSQRLQPAGATLRERLSTPLLRLGGGDVMVRKAKEMRAAMASGSELNNEVGRGADG
ncbi:hypothetical protein GCM10027091_73540 [Streptomyces daliensis]